MDERYPEEQLLYRRQFVVGPRTVDGFPTWRRHALGGKLWVTAHPDLPACHRNSVGSGVTLLGFLLDPERPEADDAAILVRLQRSLDGPEEWGGFIRELDGLGGRWVLVAQRRDETLVFNDAAGLRQVFYTDPALDGEIWCASQPSLLAEALGLPRDDEAAGSVGWHDRPEYWWPGPRTLHRGVRQLVPNHLLDLRQGVARRYWPDRALETVSLRDGVDVSAGLLRGMLDAARRRHQLALTVTAGRDTRVVLAATRAFSAESFHFSMRYWGMPVDHPDLAVPGRLLPRLGLRHHTLECPDVMDPPFERLYNRNVTASHAVYGVIAQGLYRAFPEGRLCVKANCLAVPKSHYVTRGEGKAVSPELLARLTGLERSRFVLDSFAEWLEGTRAVHDVEVLDLLYWEQRMGAWQAMTQHEWDIVLDVLDPANCRRLLGTMLAIPRRFRVGPRYRLHEALMQALWPAVLQEPVNPHERPGRWDQRLRRALRLGRLKRLAWSACPSWRPGSWRR